MTPEQDEAWEKEKRQRAQRDKMMFDSFYRRVADFKQGWRICGIPECGRNRRCCSDTFACHDYWRAEDPRVFTREETAEAMGNLYKWLQAERAKRRAQESEETVAAKTGPAKRARRGERVR